MGFLFGYNENNMYLCLMKANKYQDLPKTETDAFLIGAGIMSSTLASILIELYPNWKIQISERLTNGGLESSASLNNAGTGHSGYCELNYTPEDADGNIDITKALKVYKAFNKSKEFWGYLIRKGAIKEDFYTTTQHISFVTGQKNVEYLYKRYRTMILETAFENMRFVNKPDGLIRHLGNLIMDGRDHSIPYAATLHEGGDIDFGKLTKYLIQHLHDIGVDIRENQEVIDLYKTDDKWNIIQKNTITGTLTRIETKFVFIGAGGAAITLLEKSGIPEANGYGGFPVSGEWLICDKPEIVEQHKGKVYGRPSVGSPPMSTPHLDVRFIDGKKVLLFGPYAGMSTKFLKNGKWTDFFKSIRLSNIGVMLDAGARNLGLTKYLISELFKSKNGRFKMLQEYYPKAKQEDWKPAIAGQRVQVIKKVNGKGVIEFGTEIVSSEDGSLACLLGASPGASTSVNIMIGLLDKCFVLDEEAKTKLSEMIPSYTCISKKIVVPLLND